VYKRQGIISEVFLEDIKFPKKLNYANKLNIPYVLIIGEEEFISNTVTIKDLSTGEQSKKEKDNLIKELLKII
ncbi:MAG: His/Gly/Thr/Pro-type tRNA ligase C-terminal domain-containing protein, partial [Elusimicrobiales bacterium]|nr:His/Gly/Thr/Pro-type tRNA ligase C-terminal domain-containing protein [Elusimicrobiales bacterium]